MTRTHDRARPRAPRTWHDARVTPPSRFRPDPGARREEILAAARRVVARDGVGRATTRAIAADAGLPLGALHYWFASKDDLLEAVVLDHVEHITAAASRAVVEPGGDRAGEIEEGVRAALAQELTSSVSERLSTYELTSWALRTPGREDVAKRLYGAMREQTAALAHPFLDRHGAPGGASPAAVATLLAAFVDGLALARLADPDGTDVDGAVHLLARALGHLDTAPELPG